jgi:hypothetical protein
MHFTAAKWVVRIRSNPLTGSFLFPAVSCSSACKRYIFLHRCVLLTWLLRDCFIVLGVAIADVLYGKYNPSGKLAVTMYPPDFVNQVPLNDMSVTTPPGRTHMYYTGEAEYTFGTGLSYSTIALEMASAAPSTVDVISGSTELEYSVNLHHVAGPPGKQTVLAFWKPRNPNTPPGQVPLKQKMFGYANAFLTEGEVTTLRFTLNTDKLAVANVDGHKIVEAGAEYDIVFTDGNGLEVSAALRTSGDGARTVEEYPMA